MFKFGDKEVRLIQEQVDKNMSDIQDMKEKGAIALDGLDSRVDALEQKPECLPLTGGTISGGLDVMGRLAVAGKVGQDPMLEVGEGVSDSHLSIQANKNLYSRVFTPTNSPYTFVETMRDGVFEWTIQSGTKTATYRLPYGANMRTGNHFLALNDDVTLQSKQLETQRLEIADLDESTSQGLNEYEDTVAFTESITPIPNLLNDRKVVHGVRSILSSLDGDTKKVTVDSEPTLMGFKPKSVKMAGSNLLKINNVPETTQNGVTYSVKDGAVYLSGTSTGAFTLTLANGLGIVNNNGITLKTFLSGNLVLTSNTRIEINISTAQNYYYMQNAITANEFSTGYASNSKAATGDEMTNISIYIPSGASLTDAIISPMISFGTTAPDSFEPYHEPVDLIPTSLLNVTLNKVGTAKDQLIVYQQENGLFGVKHRKEVGEYTFTGEEFWSYESLGGRYIANFSTDCTTNPTAELTDIELPVTFGTTFGVDNKFYFYSSGFQIVCKEYIKSVADCKAYTKGKKVIYELATPTETTIASDLSLSQVSALQNEGYLVEIEAETMQYGVKGSANLIIASSDSLSDRITANANAIQAEATTRENADTALTTALGNKADYQQLGNIWSLPEGVSWSIIAQNSFKVGKLVFTHLILKTTDAIPNGGVVLASLNTSLIYPNAAHLFPFADSSNAIKIGRFSNWEGNGKWNLAAYNPINAHSTFVDFEFFFSVA